ncbi:hypothetical protein [Rhizobium sp. 1399]|uniref:hypothetical protein n=1 Tax=Rhizobium sp. 1399 TaxID=2817758 RepID=UPI00286C83A8|nr:hypothetical protein [Rhizobium sp. 1399]
MRQGRKRLGSRQGQKRISRNRDRLVKEIEHPACRLVGTHRGHDAACFQFTAMARALKRPMHILVVIGVLDIDRGKRSGIKRLARRGRHARRGKDLQAIHRSQARNINDCEKCVDLGSARYGMWHGGEALDKAGHRSGCDSLRLPVGQVQALRTNGSLWRGYRSHGCVQPRLEL